MQQDFKKAAKLYTEAAGQGSAIAQHGLGLCYKDGKGVEKNHEQAVLWFARAADQDLPEGLAALAFCYAKGYGVKKDIDKAISLMREANDWNISREEALEDLTTSNTAKSF